MRRRRRIQLPDLPFDFGCGYVGYLGYDGNLDTAITIRSAVLKDGLAKRDDPAARNKLGVLYATYSLYDQAEAAFAAALEEALGDVERDEAGGAGEEDFHGAVFAGV